MRGTDARLRYFDWDGLCHLANGLTGGQQGDPLEVLVFCLTIHHLGDGGGLLSQRDDSTARQVSRGPGGRLRR